MAELRPPGLEKGKRHSFGIGRGVLQAHLLQTLFAHHLLQLGKIALIRLYGKYLPVAAGSLYKLQHRIPAISAEIGIYFLPRKAEQPDILLPRRGNFIQNLQLSREEKLGHAAKHLSGSIVG